jgi:hypothetical protein|tara:strand:+ start:344 stop:460 length:117 start_codon:yes stop_codon:yes gene_type:complete
VKREQLAISKITNAGIGFELNSGQFFIKKYICGNKALK